jgi:hypothetical protein
MNLSGSTKYDPQLPWVSKVRSEDNKVACNFLSYVDDLRATGNSRFEAQFAAQHIASKLN